MAKAENTYELKLPQDKMELFIANKYQILNESVQMLLSGATVSAITTSVSRPTGKK
jgi:membrane-bound lytic murein transglycosylase D